MDGWTDGGWKEGRMDVEIALCGLKVKPLPHCQNQAMLTDVATRLQYVAMGHGSEF